ncbi:MAG: protein-tyrosine-phosphatase [Pseudomonadota bacterium]
MGVPGSVLFVCRHNAIRSPMAAALARATFPAIYSRSAGIEVGQADPFAAAVMDELGFDISGRRPRSIAELADTGFDLVVTLAPEAHHHVLDLARTQSFDVEYWPTLDPSVTQGSRAQILDSYRACRDALHHAIRARLAGRPGD